MLHLIVGDALAHLQGRPRGTGGHDVDADPARGELLREPLGQVVDRCLGGGVVEPVGRGDVGLERSGVYDRAALGQVGQCGLRDPERCEDVRAERLLELLVREILDRVDHDLLAGVVHHDVETAERVGGTIHEFAAGGGLGDVERDGDAGAAGIPDLVEHVVGVALLVGEVHDRDVGALAREGDRDGAADAGISARDQSLASDEPAEAPVRLLAEVGHGGHIGLHARLGLVLHGRLDARIPGDGVVECELIAIGGHAPTLGTGTR